VAGGTGKGGGGKGKVQVVPRSALWYTENVAGLAQGLVNESAVLVEADVEYAVAGACEVWKWIMSIRQDQLDRVIALAKDYGATRLILFGSAATAPETGLS